MSKVKYDLTATVYDIKGRVLAVGKNSYQKTHPYQAMMAQKVGLDEKIYLHAEIAALVKVRNVKPHKIKVERYDRHGNEMNATPCPICMMAIKEAGIKVIEHTL